MAGDKDIGDLNLKKDGKIGIVHSFSTTELVKQYIKNVDKQNDAAELKQQVNARLGNLVANYCSVPAKYQGVSLDALVDPSKQQQHAVRVFKALLQGDERLCETHAYDPSAGIYLPIDVGLDVFRKPKQPCPLRPKIGIYLSGPPGRGKTHILYAYAQELTKLFDKNEEAFKGALDSKIAKIIRDAHENGFSPSAFRRLIEEKRKDGNHGMVDVFSGLLDQSETFYQQSFERVLRDTNLGRLFSRKDLFILDFDTLYKVYQERPEVLREAIEAPVLIIDDVHFREDEARTKMMQDVLERRYNAGRRATFVNSNLALEQLVESGNVDEILKARLLSRCKEMFAVIDVSDAPDFREKRGEEWKDVIGGI